MGISPVRLPLTDAEKAQAIADRLYHIAPSGNTLRVTGDTIMAKANPAEIAFYYVMLCERGE